MLLRVCVDGIIFLSILFLPWWLGAVFAIGAAFFFRTYYEIIAEGFLIDALYGIPRAWVFDLSIVMGVFAVAAYIFIERLKKRIRARK